MDGRGIDMRAHVSTALTSAQVRGAQLILAMTRTQCRMIETAFPFARGRVYRLGEHDQLDIVDPYRRGRFTFEMAVAQIEQGVQRWLGAIAGLQH
jgi:protein-tyrosine phosphatase